MCVYKCCQTVSLLYSHKFNSNPIHLDSPTPTAKPYRHATNRSWHTWKRGEKEKGRERWKKKGKIRQMFSLAAEQRIQADGIHTEGQREERNGSWLDSICTGGVKNQLHLLEWLAHIHNKGSKGNDITSGKRILPTQVSAPRCEKIFFRLLNSKSPIPWTRINSYKESSWEEEEEKKRIKVLLAEIMLIKLKQHQTGFTLRLNTLQTKP